jgi:multisubunit Na+/H+ antiporter MnhE subunit
MSEGAFAGGGARRRGEQEPWVRRAVAWLAWWVVLTSLWLLLVASVSIPELLAGTGLVLAALWRRAVLGRRVAGRFHVVPLDPGGEDPGSAARRGLLTVGHSLAPNTVVLGIDREQGLVLVHHLVAPAQPEKDERPMDAEGTR